MSAQRTQTTTTRVTYQKSARDCMCDCTLIGRLVRVLAALTNLGVGVAAGFLIYFGAREYRYLQGGGTCTMIENTRLGVFHGVIGVWFIIFALLGFLAELRFGKLRQTVLAPFGFLLLYVGRGITYIILGCIFCSIPIDREDEVVTLVPGAIYVAVGFFELLIGLFVRKEQNVMRVSKPIPKESNRVAWGEGEHANAPRDNSAAAAPAEEMEGPAPSTPSRHKLVANDGNKAAASPVSTANPFRQATK